MLQFVQGQVRLSIRRAADTFGQKDDVVAYCRWSGKDTIDDRRRAKALFLAYVVGSKKKVKIFAKQVEKALSYSGHLCPQVRNRREDQRTYERRNDRQL